MLRISAPEGDSSAETTSEEASNAESTVLRQAAVDQSGEEISQWCRPDAPEPVRELARDAERAIDKPQLVSATYIGPLPPAAEFQRYEATYPGAADRILRMAEAEQELRGRVVDSSHEVEKWRIVAATTIPLFGLAVSAFGYCLVHPGFALPLGLAGFIGLLYKLVRPSAGDQGQP